MDERMDGLQARMHVVHVTRDGALRLHGWCVLYLRYVPTLCNNIVNVISERSVHVRVPLSESGLTYGFVRTL